MKGHLTRGRAEGTWYLRYELGRASDGKRIQRRETFRGTKAEAQSRLRVRLTEIENGTAVAERLTMDAIAVRWLSACEYRVGAKTRHRYEQIVNQYILPEIGAMRSDKLRPIHVESAVMAWRDASILNKKVKRRLSDRSIRHNFDTLRALCINQVQSMMNHAAAYRSVSF